MIISDDRLDRAMQYLAQTDNEYAEWHGAVLRSKFMAEVAESLAYNKLEGSVADRTRNVILQDEVKKAWDEHFGVVVKFNACKARRKREELVVELWRSTNANRRAGNIT